MRLLTTTDIELLQLASAGQFTLAELREHTQLEEVVDSMLLLIKLHLVEPRYSSSKGCATWITTPEGNDVLQYVAASLPVRPPWLRERISAEDAAFLWELGIRADEDLLVGHEAKKQNT